VAEVEPVRDRTEVPPIRRAVGLDDLARRLRTYLLAIRYVYFRAASDRGRSLAASPIDVLDRITPRSGRWLACSSRRDARDHRPASTCSSPVSANNGLARPARAAQGGRRRC
jgi:hypothetical protein